MRRLLIDASHILKACLHAAVKGEHATLVDDQVLPSWLDGYQMWLGSLEKTLKDLNMVPSQVVFVKDGRNASAFRREFLPSYKERPPGIPGFIEEFLRMQDAAEENLLCYGAVSVCKDGVEADDILAALAAVLPENLIWSGDKDLIAAGDVYYRGAINPDKFMGIAKKHIVVYKSLVGDTSDKLPGAKGFGDSAFLDMIGQFGDDCLDEFLEWLENETLDELEPYVSSFAPFRKILDNKEWVYASYKCAKFYHPGWHDMDWKARYPKGDGTFPQWDLKVQLITKDKLTPEFVSQFKRRLDELPWGPSFDIETWSDEESLAWGLANKTQRGPRLDVYGAHMAGFSITSGPNNNWVYYFPVDHKDTANITLEDMEMLLNLCDEKKPMFVWNEEFELPVVRKHMELRFDRGWLPNVHDVLIMKSEVNENTVLKLKPTAKTYLDYTQVTFEEVTAGQVPVAGDEDDEEEQVESLGGDEDVLDDYEPPPSRQMNELTGEETVAYGADDSICTGALANLFELIMRYEGTWRSFDMCEREPAYLCMESFLTGQKFDMGRLAELTGENEKKTAELWVEAKGKLMELEWTVGDEMSGACYTEKLPGCQYDPAFDLSAAQIKKVYLQVTGEKLKSNLRSVEKLAKLMEPTAPELAKALFMEDEELALEGSGAVQLLRFNEAGESLFRPDPQLNLGSPKQMINLLYTAMGFPIRLRGRLTDKMRAKGITKGNPKGNELAIKHAIAYDATEEQKELLLLLIEIKKLQTDKSLYLKPYVKMPNPKSGLVHGSFGQSRQKTRRFSSSAPNRTQLSNKSPIRQVYIPMFDDHVIVSFDEASQELRHAAYHSQDKAMLECFIGDNQRDIHSITGRAILEKKGEHITYEDFMARLADGDEHIAKARKTGKPATFLDQYLGTAPTLAEQLIIQTEEAQEILDAKRSAFPELLDWQNRVVEECRETGFALTPLGARKHIVLDGTWHDNHELRSALNSIIQGGAAEQIKRAMTKIWLKKITDRFDCVFLFPCHDELLFSCHIDEVVPFCREIHAIMIEPYGGMDMPWESSVEIGWNYGQMFEFSGFDAEKIGKYAEELKKAKGLKAAEMDAWLKTVRGLLAA